MPTAWKDTWRLVLTDQAVADISELREMSAKMGVPGRPAHVPEGGRKCDDNSSSLIRWGLRMAVERLQSPPVVTAAALSSTDGRRLRRAREAAGLGQSGLARLLGYDHRSSIGNIEVGRAPLAGKTLAWVEKQERGAP